jgi:2-polyprenyl-6-methoxyphenol hydroxylase-like FAD-dependent oxidoreductase
VQAGNRSRHDVVVVGGRVAGSATAMLLARLGHDVVVLDQASSQATPCPPFAARSGVVQLRRRGLLGEVLDSGAPAIRQVTFKTWRSSSAEGLVERQGVGHALEVDRPTGRELEVMVVGPPGSLLAHHDLSGLCV